MTNGNNTLIKMEGVKKVFYTDEVETHALAGIELPHEELSRSSPAKRVQLRAQRFHVARAPGATGEMPPGGALVGRGRGPRFEIERRGAARTTLRQGRFHPRLSHVAAPGCHRAFRRAANICSFLPTVLAENPLASATSSWVSPPTW